MHAPLHVALFDWVVAFFLCFTPPSFPPSLTLLFLSFSLPPSPGCSFAVPSVSTTEQSLGVYYQDRLINLQLPSTTTIAEVHYTLTLSFLSALLSFSSPFFSSLLSIQLSSLLVLRVPFNFRQFQL